LSDLPKTFSGSSGYGHVEVMPDPAQPTKLAYAIWFTGDTLDPFKLSSQQT